MSGPATQRPGASLAGKVTAYPEDAVREYRAAGLWGSATIVQEFQRVAAAHPHRDALVTEEGTLSYAELDARTDLIAARPGELVLRPGDPVVFQSRTAPRSVPPGTQLKAGLVPVCALAFHRAHELPDQPARRRAATSSRRAPAASTSSRSAGAGRRASDAATPARHPRTGTAPMCRASRTSDEAGMPPRPGWVDEIQAGSTPTTSPCSSSPVVPPVCRR